ncbi:uncharacterized protein BT62DRAFT_928878 [Guyanagaster necrorhizus]|uniref:Uncharacterized protein n=1 Tax=Guyanagaster necrorhizus TaxID=856835 RepID=A0A9P8AW06_9AGAR|nr:uncharacterized protein BT62DRAFT_928878 [Guyanagaster necrorhizus MCA 3950]KAG7450078.1 hypothetical protein BT62DRAFT_928878 [Guyanagaster necrorhizus MCA 3950]
MTGPSYPQLPWWIVPPGLPPLLHNPRPVVATTTPSWLTGTNGGSSVMFMSHAHM